jgi:acetoin utilization deacetylase AcuC-like enzyme
MIIFHDPRSAEYTKTGHPERPARILASAPMLKKRHEDWGWRLPSLANDEMLLRAHSAEHLERIRAAREDFDADTPVYANIFEHAARAAGAAVDVAREARNGNPAFSLMRPPGHHATRDQAMGFCYFSNIAIAAFDALANGAQRVGIWDFDAHHGNGTEAIVAHHDKIVFASVHQYPAYPGTGGKSFANCYNFPVAPMTPRAGHVEEVERALQRLLDFKPDLLLVSAGFDAYSRDPLVQMTLEADDFASFGEWLRECDVPAGAILEGGYSDDLPVLIDAFLSGWEIPVANPDGHEPP